MSAYINTQTLEYPLYEGDIRLAFPNVSFPKPFVAPEPFAAVTEAPAPTPGFGEVVREGAPAEASGVWTQQWVVRAETQDEADARIKGTCSQINRIRDQKIDGGFTHGGHRFQSKPSDRENIIRKGDRADRAIDGGAQPGDLTWDSTTGGQPFVWIDADNNLLPLDAQGMAALRDAGEAFKQSCTFYARALKDQVQAGGNPDINSGWPT